MNNMRISLCIPQYNRIKYLLKNLYLLEKQDYPDIEVVVSDDASIDNTEEAILKIKENYKFPLHYHRIQTNVGYDTNFRKSLELASGDYCFVLGNDDTLEDPGAISRLVEFLKANDLPEVGFCNYVEAHSPDKPIERASFTGVIGSGESVALKYYRSFSYVAGIILIRDQFLKYNTGKVDGSVYVQMYLAAIIIAKGGRLFMYKEAMVTKDIQIDGSMANSYRDTLMRSWKDYRPIDGGLKQVVRAVLQAFSDAVCNMDTTTYQVLSNIYTFTYPYWLFDYRSNGSYIGAYALSQGLKPGKVPATRDLKIMPRASVHLRYFLSSVIGLFVPVFIFNGLKLKIYKQIKR